MDDTRVLKLIVVISLKERLKEDRLLGIGDGLEEIFIEVRAVE
jgi:hypothetical protein